MTYKDETRGQAVANSVAATDSGNQGEFSRSRKSRRPWFGRRNGKMGGNPMHAQHRRHFLAGKNISEAFRWVAKW